MKRQTFSVITLTHNKLPVTQRCLRSLLGTTGTHWELVVVDNGSTDGTPDWLESFREEAAIREVAVTIIRNPNNIGCATARNQGANAATGDYLTFVDNDVALRCTDWLTALATRLHEPRAGMVGPKLVYPYTPHNIQCAGVGISREGRVQFRGRGEPRMDARFNREEPVQCLISACCMVRRAIFEQTGGFDPAFDPVEFEDFDLCYRIRERGDLIIYVPSVEMYHFESITTAGTTSLPNTRLIILHGLRFKERWRHRFSNENGPAGAETRWRKFALPTFETVGALPLTHTRAAPRQQTGDPHEPKH